MNTPGREYKQQWKPTPKLTGSCPVCWGPIIQSTSEQLNYCDDCRRLLDDLQQKRLKNMPSEGRCPVQLSRYVDMWGR